MSEPVPMLYTQTGCADSRKVRAWLTAHGVPFVERNVTGDLEAAQFVRATGLFATPLLVLGDAKMLGFRPDTLSALLERTTPA